MILPDLNLLIYAYNSDDPRYDASKAWWEGLLNGSNSVGLAWVTALGFVRLTTHRQVMTHPLPVAASCAHVRAWLRHPSVSILHPGDRHAEILFGLLEALGTAGNLTTDAHVAALAIEHQAELHSTDVDFARFPGLRWSNPIG